MREKIQKSTARWGLKASVLMLFFSIFSFVFLPYLLDDVNAATEEVVSTVTWSPISLTLSDGGAVNFGTMTPSSEGSGNVGTMKVLKKNISVTSNGKAVNVYLSMVGDGTGLEYSYGSTTDSSISIPAVTEAGDSPDSFGGSGWGYAVRAKGAGELVDPVSDMGFSSGATYEAYDSKVGQELTKATDTAVYNTGKWKMVPVFGAPDIVWSVQTTNPKGFGGEGETTLNNFDVYYAAIVGTNVIAGTYQNSVVYTALASAEEIDSVSNNINVSNLTSGGKYAANGDKIRLEFDLAQSESGAVSRDKVHIYLLPHGLMASNGYTLTSAIRSAAENGDYPTCAIGNDSADFNISGSGTVGASINCVVSGATIANAEETATPGTFTDDLDGDSYKDGYYDVWVYINNGFELDYISKYMVAGGGSSETLAFVGLQSQKIKSTNDGVEPVITEMQDMTTGICHSTNKWGTKTGTAARVYDYTGTGDPLANTMAGSIALGVGTFRLKDNRDNKYYLVRHLADGNCWMVQNLDLELADAGSAYTMTKDNTDLNTSGRTSYDPGATVAALSGATVQAKLKMRYGDVSTCQYQFQPKGTSGGGCRWGTSLNENVVLSDGSYVFSANASHEELDKVNLDGGKPINRSYIKTAAGASGGRNTSATENGGNYLENNSLVELPRSYDNGYDYISRAADTWTGGSSPVTSTTALDKDALTPNGDNAETQYMGHYYNWYAATAESGKFSDIDTASEAADSICPRGWQLPASHTADSTKSWQNLLTTTYWGDTDNRDGASNLSSAEGAAMLHKMPLSIVFSGYYNWVVGGLSSRGSGGGYWSSTPNSNYYNAYNLNFGSTNVNPQGSNNKPYGFTIRCVAR